MAKIIYQVVRYRKSNRSNLLTLNESYNSFKDAVTKKSWLELDHGFSSGLIYALEDGGKLRYFFELDKEVLGEGGVLLSNLNFSQAHMDKLQDQIDLCGDILTRPPMDEDGVSQLKGYQLHVIIKDGEEMRIDQKDNQTCIFLEPNQIEDVILVTKGEVAYAPGKSNKGGHHVSMSMLMDAVFTPPSETEEPKVESALDLRKALTKKNVKRSEARKKRQRNKEKEKAKAKARAAEAKAAEAKARAEEEEEELETTNSESAQKSEKKTLNEMMSENITQATLNEEKEAPAVAVPGIYEADDDDEDEDDDEPA